MIARIVTIGLILAAAVAAILAATGVLRFGGAPTAPLAPTETTLVGAPPAKLEVVPPTVPLAVGTAADVTECEPSATSLALLATAVSPNATDPAPSARLVLPIATLPCPTTVF